MACMNDGTIDGFGDWVRKANQNPPNANQANRNQAQTSSTVALRGAAATHCAEGNANCPGGNCVVENIWNWVHTFEDGTFQGVHYIRCNTKAAVECHCPQPAPGQGNNEGEEGEEGEGNGEGEENRPPEEPELPENPTVVVKKPKKK